MDHFYDMIRTAQDDEILKVLKSSVVREISRRYIHQMLEVPNDQLSQAIIALHQVFLLENSLPIISHCEYSELGQSLTSATLNVNSYIGACSAAHESQNYTFVSVGLQR